MLVAIGLLLLVGLVCSVWGFLFNPDPLTLIAAIAQAAALFVLVLGRMPPP